MAQVTKLSGSSAVVKSRGFVRDTNLDFSDDGNRFLGYMWEEKVPLTQCCGGGKTYLSVRSDYLQSDFGIPYNFWQQYEASKLGEEYNGTSEKIDLDNLVSICEAIYEGIQKAKKDFENIEVDPTNVIPRLEGEIKTTESTLNRNLNWFEVNLSTLGIEEAYNTYNKLKRTYLLDVELLKDLKEGKVSKYNLYGMACCKSNHSIGKSIYYAKLLNGLIDQKSYSMYYLEKKGSMQ